MSMSSYIIRYVDGVLNNEGDGLLYFIGEPYSSGGLDHSQCCGEVQE